MRTRRGGLNQDKIYIFMNTHSINYMYSRVPPCGHSSYVDTPLLWTLFSRPICFSYIMQDVHYCGRFANVDTFDPAKRCPH